MIELCKKIDVILHYPINKVTSKKALYFDIETTGFHAASTFLYLIGCAYQEGTDFYLKQWFSEGVDDEILVLKSFLAFATNFETLLHFNGTTFDLPYLSKKCEHYQLDNTLSDLEQIDFYKRITPYKKAFGLSSCRQKSIEEFLHIHRDDVYDGGELIQVYANYIGAKKIEQLKMMAQSNSESNSPSDSSDQSGPHSSLTPSGSSKSEELLSLLLLHNADDIGGLVKLTDIMYYIDIFSKPLAISKVEQFPDKVVFHLDTLYDYPTPLRLSNGDITLNISSECSILEVAVYEGELKHFYPDVKNYYYLPLEDTAIHKSVAEFVDKEFRQKATKENCYTKKTGCFLPCQKTNAELPLFQFQCKDKLAFIELTEEFLQDKDAISNYTSSILTYLFS